MNTDKLVSGTNLWIEWAHGAYVIYFLAETTPIVLATLVDDDDVIMFVKGFRACLTHVNGVELREINDNEVKR